MASVVPKDSATTPNRLPHDAATEPLSVYIRQSAKSIHRTELTVGFLAWLVMGLGMIFAFVLIDHWVVPFNGPLRYGAWLLLVSGSLIWLFLRVAPLLGRSINPEYAAKKIEETIPEMKDGLISWLQLSSNDSIPRGVLNAVGRYVAKHLKGQDVASVIDQFASMKLAAMLFGMMLIGAIYLAVSPKSGVATIRRLLMPWADIAPSTRVQIVTLSPGDATVTEGSSLLVSIQVRGWLRGDEVRIRFSTDDGQSVDQSVAMNAEIEGVSYSAEFGKSFGGLVRPIHYYIEAGDAKAGPFAIRIQAVPLVVLERVEYAYPAYMRLAPRISEGDGRIEAPEGTRVTVIAKANQAIKKARIEYDTKLEKDSAFHVASADDVTIDERSIKASVLLKLDDAKSNPTRLRYRIRSENERGEENVEPVVYPIKVIPDLAPEVQLANGIKDTIDLPVNQNLGLEVRAIDPDFGLMRLSLVGKVENQNVLSQELFRNEQGSLAPVNQTYSFDPAALRLRLGMQVELVAIAEDNRRAIGSDQLEPNIRQSRIVRIRITPPSENPSNAKANDNKNPSSDSSASSSSDPSKPAKDKAGKNASQQKKPDQPDKSSDPNDRKSSNEKGKQQKSEDQGKPEPKSTDDADSKSSPDAKQGDQQNQNGQQQGKPQGNQKGEEKSGEEKSGEGQSGAGESGAGQPAAGKNQPGAGQNQPGANGPSEGSQSGDPSSDGQDSPSGASSSSENSKPSKGSGQSGEAKHDGETFEELREALGQKSESGDTEGTGQSTDDESTDSQGKRSTKSSDTPSGKGKPSDEDASNSDSNSSDTEPGTSEKPTSNKDGANQNNASSKDSSSKDAPTGSNSESTNQDRAGDSANPKASSGNQSESGKPDDASQSSSNQNQGNESKTTKSAADQGKPSDTQAQGSKQPGSQQQNPKAQDGQADENSMKGDGKGNEPGKPEPGPGTQESSDNTSKNSASEETDGKQSKADQSSPSKNSPSGKQDAKQGKQGEQGSQAQEGTPSPSGKQGESGEQPGESGKGSESSNKAGKATQESKGNISGKNPTGNDSATGAGPDPVAPAKKEQATAEVEYARQATDMVLKALERQREQPDPELLKRMGWSKEQLQAFLDRWKNARESAEANPQKKREYDESLRSLGLMPDSGKTRNDKGRDDRLRGMNEEGSRLLPPESLRERFEAFRKSTMNER